MGGLKKSGYYPSCQARKTRLASSLGPGEAIRGEGSRALLRYSRLPWHVLDAELVRRLAMERR
jgi:hypothetical protein